MVLIVRRVGKRKGGRNSYEFSIAACQMALRNKNRSCLRRFGAVVREHRRAKSLSQEELAFRSKLDRSYVGGVERGERNLSFVNVVRLAEGLGIKLAALFEAFEDLGVEGKK
ncbi:MAG: helix-turn-helix domain-containing protein [Candidatus Binataceae bacterium]